MQAGLWSPEIGAVEVPTLSQPAEGNIVGGVIREPLADLAGSENLCMHGISMRENREVPGSPACGDGRAGRAGKAKAVIP